MKLKSYIAVSLCAFALAGCSDDDKKIGCLLYTSDAADE